MKSNQKLTVEFSKGSFNIFHQDLMADANMFFDILNKYRLEIGLSTISLQSWLKTTSAKEFIKYLDETYKHKHLLVSRGKHAITKAHLKVILKAAIDLAPSFADEVIETFIDKRLPYLRDKSGDNFIEMNDALTLYAESVLGKPAHKGHFITLAKIIKKRLEVEDWNHTTPSKLAERTRIEEALSTMLKAGVVRDWDHLKDLAEIV